MNESEESTITITSMYNLVKIYRWKLLLIPMLLSIAATFYAIFSPTLYTFNRTLQMGGLVSLAEDATSVLGIQTIESNEFATVRLKNYYATPEKIYNFTKQSKRENIVGGIAISFLQNRFINLSIESSDIEVGINTIELIANQTIKDHEILLKEITKKIYTELEILETKLKVITDENKFFKSKASTNPDTYYFVSKVHKLEIASILQSKLKLQNQLNHELTYNTRIIGNLNVSRSKDFGKKITFILAILIFSSFASVFIFYAINEYKKLTQNTTKQFL